MDKEIFGKRLDIALELRGVTQKELASLINTTEDTISRYVKGERMPKADVFMQICDALNVETGFLMGTKRGIKV